MITKKELENLKSEHGSIEKITFESMYKPCRPGYAIDCIGESVSMKEGTVSEAIKTINTILDGIWGWADTEQKPEWEEREKELLDDGCEGQVYYWEPDYIAVCVTVEDGATLEDDYTERESDGEYVA